MYDEISENMSGWEKFMEGKKKGSDPCRRFEVPVEGGFEFKGG